MKVALVHDYLREYGGAERVLEELHNIFPGAPIYTAYYNPKKMGIFGERTKDWNIKVSWYQYFPFTDKNLSLFRILASRMFESFDLSEYDLVISSSSIYYSKAVRTKPPTLHIAYIHTPPKYLYGYTTSFNYKKHWWTRIGAELVNHFLRLIDFEISQRPDILVANSKTVQARIKKFYRRDSVVINPPVDVEMFSSNLGIGEGNYFLSLNRLWKGKGIDVIVQSCIKLKLPLKVASTGPELENLKQLVKDLKGEKFVEFLGLVPDSDLPALYRGASALIQCAEDEDFGIIPVECMAAGTPVIALRAGGYTETIIEGKTGEFFDQPTVQSLSEVLQNFDYTKYKIEDCYNQAKKFSKERFKEELLGLIDKNIKKD